MKMLFISSGYRRVYPYFEQALCRAFAQVGVKVVGEKPCPVQRVAALKKLCATHQVDWLFMFLGNHLPEDFRQALQARDLPPLAVWFTEDPYHIERSINVLPVVKRGFTVEEGAVKFYQKLGGNVSFLPLGYDEDTFYPQEKKQVYDVCFVGHPYPERVTLLKSLASALRIQIEVVGPWRVDQLPKKVIHRSRWLHPRDVAHCYHRAKVVLNTFRPYEKGGREIFAKSVNNRSFEIAACAGFQLSEHRPGIARFFSKQEIETFTDTKNCIQAVRFYLENKKKRDEKRKKAAEEVRRAHTFFHRASHIVSQLQKVN